VNTADRLRAQVAGAPPGAYGNSPELNEASILRVASVLDAVARCRHLNVRFPSGQIYCWFCGTNCVKP